MRVSYGGTGSVMGEPFAGSPIAFNQGSGCKIRKKFALPKVRQIKKDADRRLFYLVDPKGFEPSASAMRTRRSPN